jgi:hypothetical protein
MVTIYAIPAHIAGHMMGYKYPVSLFPIRDPSAHRVYLAGYFVAQHQGRLGQSVPFQDITAANTAAPDLNQNLILPDLRRGRFLQTYITIRVVHGHTHGAINLQAIQWLKSFMVESYPEQAVTLTTPAA